jgi:hypothetical protein
MELTEFILFSPIWDKVLPLFGATGSVFSNYSSGACTQSYGIEFNVLFRLFRRAAPTLKVK